MRIKKSRRIYGETTLTPMLKHYWRKISSSVYPKNATAYIRILSEISSWHRNNTNAVLAYLYKNSAIGSDWITNLELRTCILYEISVDIEQEFKKRYRLTRKNRRLLRRTVHKNEQNWNRFGLLLGEFYQRGIKLYSFEENDFISLYSPQRFDFATILKDFQKKSFQKN